MHYLKLKHKDGDLKSLILIGSVGRTCLPVIRLLLGPDTEFDAI